MSRHGREAPPRAWRWPALLLVPLLIAAGIVAESRLDDDPNGTGEVLSEVLLPTASAPGAPSTTWYCAGGTATGAEDGAAEHVVHIVNDSDQGAVGTLTAYPVDAAPVSTPIDIRAHGRQAIRLSDVVVAPFAAALVELGGGEVAVQHEIAGPSGRALGACASAPSDTWYFPAGTTRPGTRMVLAVFNPFPEEAVVDLSFDTEDGTRTPQAYQALVVPGGAVLPLEVTDVVTLRAEVSTQVVARTGRVVVDQIQIADGTEEAPRGMALTLGAPSPGDTWLFPDGVGAEGYRESIVVFNPGETPAEVDVQVLLDDPATNGVAEPFEVTVGAGRYASVEVFEDGRVPVGVAHAIVVRSRNEQPVVAERVIIGSADSAQAGLAYTIGAPLVSSRWIVPVASLPGVSAAALVVFNPSSTETVRITAQAVGDGELGASDGVADVELGPGERTVVDLGVDGQGFSALALDVRAAGVFVAEIRFGFEEGDDISYLVAVPVSGSLSMPLGTVGDLSTDAVVVGGS